MMKVTRLIFGILAAVTLPLLSCTREIVEVTPPQESEGQSLHISIGSDFTTKSALTNTGASQHIEHMYAYLFRQESGNDDFTCFYAVDMDWTPVDGTGISDFSYRISREAGLQAMGDQLIKVLVVAVDNHPETYNISDADFRTVFSFDAVEEIAENKLSFEDAKAVIASAVAGEDGTTTGTPEAEAKAKAWAMAHTELFSGSTEAVPANTPVIEVTIDRCVAGVLCYLTDIPYLVESGDEESRTHTIELRLKQGLDLNTSVTLTGDALGGVELGSDDSKEVVIASADLSMYTEPQGAQGEKGSLLYIPATDDGTVKTLENSILFGAYMVPIAVADEGDGTSVNATLRIVAIGDNSNGVDVYEKTYYVRNTADGNKAADEHPVAVDGRDYHYSLQANRLYAIGTKPTSGDTEGDRPASLAGDELLLNVVNWVDDINPDVQFPSYSLGASFVSNISPDYIYDCIGGITLTATVLPSASKGGWSITPVYAGDETEWIRFRVVEADGIPGEWKQDTYNRPEESSDEAVQIEIMFEDYVKFNDIMGGTGSIEYKIEALENDYRTCKLKLETDQESSVDYLTINQYNAITARLYDDDGQPVGSDGSDVNNYRGFSRDDLLLPSWDNPDYDDERNYSYTGWGFYGSSPTYFMDRSDTFDNDGELNCTDSYSYCYDKGGDTYSNYLGSALYRGRKAWTDFSNSVNYWFTPARYEMNGFFQQVAKPLLEYYYSKLSFNGDYENHYEENVIPVINIKYDRLYWSSSATLDRNRKSWAYRINDAGVSEVDMYRARVKYLYDYPVQAYIRQARKFE